MPDPRQIVVFAPYALWAHHFGTDLEIVQKHVHAGDDVTVLACDQRMAACDINANHDRFACLQCAGTQRAGLQLVAGDVRVEPFYRLTDEDESQLDNLQTQFADIDALKSYRVEDFDIGMAALSSLVSLLRDPEPNLDEHGPLLSKLLRTAWMVYRSFQHLLHERTVDCVYTFNARFAPLRGVLRACQQRGVECVTHDRGHDHRHYAVYPNTLPHDEQLFQQRVHQMWESAADSNQREQIAEDWFLQRAQGVAQSWFSFVADQDQGQLPRDWNPARRNVVVFSSSEDEFVAINDRWSTSLYESQLEAMQAILQDLSTQKDNLHLYLRIHPNLAGLDNRQARELHALRAPNLTVIPADAVTSSYALLQAADKVVTFRSTVGIEAVYWGIPSILVGSAFYRDLGGTYNPTSHGELLQLMRSDLAPKSREAALMFGYYSATFGQPFRHFAASDFFEGIFQGSTLQPAAWDRFKIWLLKRPSSIRRELARFTEKTGQRTSRKRAA